MKKYSVLLLLIVFSLSGCFNNETGINVITDVKELKKSTYNELEATVTEQHEGVKLSLEKKTFKNAEKILLIITNTGERDVTFDNSYQLEYLNNDNWFINPVIEDIDFTVVGKILKPNTSSEIVIDFNNHTFNKRNGKYRIVKKIDKSSALAVSFYLK